MKHSSKQRPAIAMVELVFAIVVMGIAMMSAPMLISTSVQSTNVALQQEAINEAAAKVNRILHQYWDENLTNDSNDSERICILHVNDGDSALDTNTGNRRIGVPAGSNNSGRTFNCKDLQIISSLNDLNASTTLGRDDDDEDDLDDYIDTSLIEVSRGTGGSDYIEKTTVKMSTTVKYVSDTAIYNNQIITYNIGADATAGRTTNIKAIDVTLTSSSGVVELNKTIVLHAFSCNIGGFDFARREF